MDNILRRWSLIAVLFVLGGCASIDFDQPKAASTAILPENTADSQLGRMLEPFADAHPGQAGFYLLPGGIEALAIRLLMAERGDDHNN